MTLRERRLWLAAGGCLLAIYAAIFFARGVVDFLRARGELRLAVLAAFAVAAALVGWRVLRSRPSWRELLAVGLAGTLYVLVVARLERHEERLHFLEYGLLAGLVEAALRERGRRWAGLGAIALTAAAGWLDEGIQGLVPSRVYDLRDVVFNATAGILAVLTVTLRRLARSRDSR